VAASADFLLSIAGCQYGLRILRFGNGEASSIAAAISGLRLPTYALRLQAIDTLA
jgi:hypothetical protein